MKKSKLAIAALPVAALLAFASSTRCFAETRAETKSVEKKAMDEKSLKVKVDLSSPEATVRSLVAAFSAGEFVSLPKCIWGAKPISGSLQQIFKQEFEQSSASYEVKDIKVFIDSKPVILEALVTARGGGKVITSRSRLEMQRDNEGWKIILALWPNLTI